MALEVTPHSSLHFSTCGCHDSHINPVAVISLNNIVKPVYVLKQHSKDCRAKENTSTVTAVFPVITVFPVISVFPVILVFPVIT